MEPMDRPAQLARRDRRDPLAQQDRQGQGVTRARLARRDRRDPWGRLAQRGRRDQRELTD